MANARAPRTPTTNVSLSVGLLMLLLIASLVLYRFGGQAATSLTADISQPPELWRVPLSSEARGVATAGRYTYILTNDKLGAAALMIIDDKGLLVRTEPLGSAGQFTVSASPLGVICAGRDQGTLSLYGPDGTRRWTVHLPGPAGSVAVDEYGVSAVFGPQPGAKAGDGVQTVARTGTVGSPVVFPYGAVTAVARGPGRTTAVSVFTADPQKAAEALVFLQPGETSFPVAGQGLGAARLAADAELYFVGTARGVSAYDSGGERRWATRSAAVIAVAARNQVVVAVERNAIAGYDGSDGRRLWRHNLSASTATIANDTDGVVVAGEQGLTAFDWQGQPRWALPDCGSAWNLGDGTLVVIQREMAIAYRTR